MGDAVEEIHRAVDGIDDPLAVGFLVAGDTCEGLVKAVEKSANATEVMAPELTVFNTERAYVSVINEVSFLQDFDVDVANTAFIANPTIGVLQEGFGHRNSEPDVDAKVRAAAERFQSLGATVEPASVPEHLTLGFPVWAAIRGDAMPMTTTMPLAIATRLMMTCNVVKAASDIPRIMTKPL